LRLLYGSLTPGNELKEEVKMSLPKVKLHGTGPEISRVAQGFGSLVREEQMDAKKLAEYIDACVDEGITAYDLASVYSGGEAESLFGEVLAMRPGLRERITIITKYGIAGGGDDYHCYDTSKEAIIQSAERSLIRMKLEHIDVFLMHRPDMLMDADEVAGALNVLLKSGKASHFGVSNFLPHQVDLLASRLDFPLIVNEVPYSLFDMTSQENGALDQCQQRGITPLFYSPLGGGRLFNPVTSDDDRLLETMRKIAAEFGGVPVEQVAVAWVLKHPARGAAILGCGRAEWMRNAAAGAKLVLTRDQWFRLWTAAKGHEIP